MKRKPCSKCNGPCGPDNCCATMATPCTSPAPLLEQARTETSSTPHGSQADEGQAADIFMATVLRMKTQRAAEEAAAAATAAAEGGTGPTSCTPPAPERKRSLVQQARVDGRKRRRFVAPLPLSFGELPDWLRRKPAVGGVLIDNSHIAHLAWHRGITWCWSCGTFALEVPNKLRKKCKAATTAGARQLVRFRLGQTPRNEVSWVSDAGPPELHSEKEESHH